MKTTIKTNKQAISLIVLVITIIVMIILAGAIILTLNNSGIIKKASEAVDASDEMAVKELAQLAWAEAYADGVRTVEGEDGFQARIEEALEKNNIDPDKYLLNITTSGVTVKLLDKAWVKEGFTVVRGEDVLEIGDTVAYDETAGGTKTGLTATEWKVLGADADGNLLLMSTTDVKTGHRLGYDTTDTTTEAQLASAQNDWLNGAAELDSICEAYGYGEGVVGKARSITVEDVNAVTGYDPKTYNSETGTSGEPFGKGRLYQYENTVTYSYNATAGERSPAYSSVVVSGTLSNAHVKGFYYYDGKEFKHITDLATGERGKVFATLTSNYYYYYASDLTTISSETNSKAYQMIFGESEDSGYWLASLYAGTYTYYTVFGLFGVVYGDVLNCDLWRSDAHTYNYTYGVRAIVTLSSNIQLTGSSASGWSY